MEEQSGSLATLTRDEWVAEHHQRRGGSATRKEDYIFLRVSRLFVNAENACLGDCTVCGWQHPYQHRFNIESLSAGRLRRAALPPNNVCHIKVTNQHTTVHGSFSQGLTLGVHDGDYIPC
jgi:hypothetical protein